jgi:hypothetical protein
MGEEESLAESLDVLSPDGIRSGRSKLRYLCSILFWRHFFDSITLLCFYPMLFAVVWGLLSEFLTKIVSEIRLGPKLFCPSRFFFLFMRRWFRLPRFFNIILLSWHAFGLGLWKASCACWWWLSRRGACVDLCGEHRWIAATEAGWSQGFMARPVGHFQCWTYICWGHFPHNCQASSTSISICVCVCVWVTLIRWLWLHLLSF